MLRAVELPRISEAMRIMRSLNPNALVGLEDGKEVFIEDVRDPDGRWYRLEYQVNRDGHGALAFCRYNPWPPPPYRFTDTHLMPDNSICTSDRAHTGGDGLEYTVRRARLWCVGYSFLCEHGLEALRSVMEDW